MRIYHIPGSDISCSVDSISYILIGTAVNPSLICADTSQILIAENGMTPLLEHQTIAMYRVSQSNKYIRRQTFTAHAPSQPAISSVRIFQNHACLKLQGYGDGPHSDSPTSRTHTFIFIRRTERSIRTRTNSNGAGYFIRYSN